jgi:hypothetical protein
MRYIALALLSLSAPFIQDSFAQETPSIRVRKSSNLAKAVFDNTTYALVVFDRFGNPTETKILYYQLHVKLKRETRVFEVHSNVLSADAIRFLNGLNSSTKLFFTQIKAEEEGGHVTELPDAIETWFPQCTNCDKSKKRR